MASAALKSFIALQKPAYRRFWYGHLVSVLGTSIQNTALSWLVYRLTASSAALGVAAFAQNAPILFLGLAGGSLADRHSRRRLLMFYYAIFPAVSIALAWVARTGEVPVSWIYGLCVIHGILVAFEIPARQSWIKDLAGVERLASGIALNSIAFNLGRMVGPPLAGWMILSHGEAVCFSINAFSFLVIFASIASLPQDAPPAPRVREITPSLREVLDMPLPRNLLLMVTFLSLFGVPIYNMLPVFAKNVFGRGPEALGMLNGFSGLGAVLGSFLASIKDPEEFKYRNVLLGAAGFVTFFTLFALPIPYPLALVCAFGLGSTLLYTLIHTNHLLQTGSPEDFRGRVISVYSSLLIGLAPFGALLMGTLADRLGIRTAVAMHAGVLIAFVIYRWGAREK